MIRPFTTGCGIITDKPALGGLYKIMTSVIIPTLNAAKQIRGLLTALKSQTVRCEIIIVDSSSSDDTAEIARSLGADVLSIKR